jgi:hypothetical protein
MASIVRTPSYPATSQLDKEAPANQVDQRASGVKVGVNLPRALKSVSLLRYINPSPETAWLVELMNVRSLSLTTKL